MDPRVCSDSRTFVRMGDGRRLPDSKRSVQEKTLRLALWFLLFLLVTGAALLAAYLLGG